MSPASPSVRLMTSAFSCSQLSNRPCAAGITTSRISSPDPSLASIAASNASSPCPDAADTKTGGRSARDASCCSSPNRSPDTRSTLFQTSRMWLSAGRISMPRSPSTFSTSWACACVSSCAISRTCRIKSASMTSSSVARNAATSIVGRSEMNPTVSDKMMRRALGSFTSRIVGSSVANTWSMASTPAPVMRLNSVDLPALV